MYLENRNENRNEKQYLGIGYAKRADKMAGYGT